MKKTFTLKSILVTMLVLALLLVALTQNTRLSIANAKIDELSNELAKIHVKPLISKSKLPTWKWKCYVPEGTYELRRSQFKSDSSDGVRTITGPLHFACQLTLHQRLDGTCVYIWESDATKSGQHVQSVIELSNDHAKYFEKLKPGIQQTLPKQIVVSPNERAELLGLSIPNSTASDTYGIFVTLAPIQSATTERSSGIGIEQNTPRLGQ